MRPWHRIGLGALLATIAAAGMATWWAHQRLFVPFRTDPSPVTTVSIPAGEPATQILRHLQRAGVLADARLARLYLVYRLGNPPLKAGEYEFREPLPAPAVLQRLIRGDVVTHPVTLVEGLTIEDTASALATAGFGAPAQFLPLMQSPELVSDLDPRADSLEGYLFPDTYRFARNTPPRDIVRTLVETFKRHYRDEIQPLLTEKGGSRSVHAVVTLASIVEKEAALDSERPIIAAVYRNRLKRDIALYADPTVIYALRLAGTWDGNLTRTDLQIDSPYNTYRYPGLPPGPICSPGLASLRAAAAPAAVPYLYFVSRNDGSHVFASTLREHNRNVARWQKRYWRERWARERADSAPKDRH
jgi:UPF0755 protein